MKTLTAMMRKQKIEIDMQRQALHSLRQRFDASNRDLEQTRKTCGEAEHYLWAQLSAEQEISLDRLNLARLRHDEQQDACARAEAHLQHLSGEVKHLEKAILRAEKTLEKFAEVFAARQREARQEAQRREWQALDEHVLARLEKRQRA
jgi:uncharacterized coiled-coil protein SlyX